MAKNAIALQLCPFSPAMEQELAQAAEIVRWFDLSDAQQEELLAARGAEVQVVVTGGHIGCSETMIRALPKLRLIAINGVGFDKVPLPLTRERGIAVTNTPGVLTDDVADLCIGLIIALKRQIPAADQFVRSGQWTSGELPLGRKVSGLRFGILGLGAIGEAIAARLAPFGEVGYFSRSAKDVPYCRFDTLTELAKWGDVLVVACSSNQETAGIVDAEVLANLGEGGCVINISRGAVVQEDALIEALTSGKIAGAGLDVFADEPNVPAALRDSPRTVLTPHIASATVETRAAMADLVLANVRAVLDGQPPISPVP